MEKARSFLVNTVRSWRLTLNLRETAEKRFELRESAHCADVENQV